MTVTPPKPIDELAEAAVRLSRAAPNMWVEFMKAFDVYTTTRRDACVHATADKVLIAQGMARQCVELSAAFNTAKQK